MNGPLDGRKPEHPADAVDADTVLPRNGVSVSSVNGVNGLEGAELVHAYARAQALADGVLVDVTEAASPAGMLGGFTVPVAVTAALWSAIEAIPKGLAGLADVRGRLHDVLWMARVAAQRLHRESSGTFGVLLPTQGSRKRLQALRIEIGPNDLGGPCVTIGFPEDF